MVTLRDKGDASEARDASWTSHGLAKPEAMRQWQDWAASNIAPMVVIPFDDNAFAARWSSHGIGQLRLLHLHAPAQRVIRQGDEGQAGKATPSIQLVYARVGVLDTQVAGRRFDVAPGSFVLLDNTKHYQMDMQTSHEVADLMMPLGWLDRYLPDPQALLGQPLSVREGWGAPLGALLETMLDSLDTSPLPRSMVAEQVGSLLALATGFHEPPVGRHGAQLARQVLRRIESDFADPELTPQRIADDLGISKRYLQALLAGSGTSFVQELNATRLDRAGDMLADPAYRNVAVGEIAWRCGFLDPGYFTRLFRKRYAVAPRQYRAGHQSNS
ncbi:MAG: helix-turn-helix domain-containing protein [Sphingomonadaceae bacterium]|nr:helix-turn-helix domain-containing protein [Sphingomonadaceae bacterium]